MKGWESGMVWRLALLTIFLCANAGICSAQGGAPPPSMPQQDAQQLENLVQNNKCDGSARSGNTKGQMRSISDCDRKAAAARTAARRAAHQQKGVAVKGGKP